eukprot:GHVR01060278.1.p1 GENE.GHVR01060278.1~~GHVR01060278.1.p1  ORF type:complete len:426 (+),score=56.72 GHVR01060278.1:36-1313(+)
MNRFLSISLLAVTVCCENDFNYYFARILGFNKQDKIVKGTVVLERKGDFYTFGLNLFEGLARDDFNDTHTHTHTCVFDHDTTDFSFQYDDGLKDLLKEKNCKYDSTSSSYHCGTQQIRLFRDDNMSKYFWDKYDDSVSCTIGIRGATKATDAGVFFYKKIIQFTNQNGAFTAHFYEYDHYVENFFFREAARINLGAESVIVSPEWGYSNKNQIDNNQINNSYKFDMTNHYTKVNVMMADIIIRHITSRNPGCEGFENIIKQAITDKKIIGKNVVINEKYFWAECGNKLIDNITAYKYDVYLYDDDTTYKSAFTLHVENSEFPETNRDFDILFINDNFKEPESELSKLSTDPWNIRFVPDSEQIVVYGISMLEEKQFSTLLYYPHITRESVVSTDKNQKDNRNLTNSCWFGLYYSNSKPYNEEIKQ